MKHFTIHFPCRLTPLGGMLLMLIASLGTPSQAENITTGNRLTLADTVTAVDDVTSDTSSYKNISASKFYVLYLNQKQRYVTQNSSSPATLNWSSAATPELRSVVRLIPNDAKTAYKVQFYNGYYGNALGSNTNSWTTAENATAEFTISVADSSSNLFYFSSNSSYVNGGSNGPMSWNNANDTNSRIRIIEVKVPTVTPIYDTSTATGYPVLGDVITDFTNVGTDDEAYYAFFNSENTAYKPGKGSSPGRRGFIAESSKAVIESTSLYYTLGDATSFSSSCLVKIKKLENIDSLSIQFLDGLYGSAPTANVSNTPAWSLVNTSSPTGFVLSSSYTNLNNESNIWFQDKVSYTRQIVYKQGDRDILINTTNTPKPEGSSSDPPQSPVWKANSSKGSWSNFYIYSINFESAGDLFKANVEPYFEGYIPDQLLGLTTTAYNSNKATYEAYKLKAEASPSTLTVDEYESLLAVVQNSANFNCPTSGWYRVYNKGTQKYVQGVSALVADAAEADATTTSSMVYVTVNDASNHTYTLTCQGETVGGSTATAMTVRPSDLGYATFIKGENLLTQPSDGTSTITLAATDDAISDYQKWCFEPYTSKGLSVALTTQSVGEKTYSYATYYAPFASQLSSETATAYTIAYNIKGDSLVRSTIPGNVIPAGTPAIIIDESGASSVAITIPTTAAVALSQRLVGVYLSQTWDTSTMLQFSGYNTTEEKYYFSTPAAATSTGPNKAYLLTTGSLYINDSDYALRDAKSLDVQVNFDNGMPMTYNPKSQYYHNNYVVGWSCYYQPQVYLKCSGNELGIINPALAAFNNTFGTTDYDCVIGSGTTTSSPTQYQNDMVITAPEGYVIEKVTIKGTAVSGLSGRTGYAKIYSTDGTTATFNTTSETTFTCQPKATSAIVTVVQVDANGNEKRTAGTTSQTIRCNFVITLKQTAGADAKGNRPSFAITEQTLYGDTHGSTIANYHDFQHDLIFYGLRNKKTGRFLHYDATETNTSHLSLVNYKSLTTAQDSSMVLWYFADPNKISSSNSIAAPTLGTSTDDSGNERGYIIGSLWTDDVLRYTSTGSTDNILMADADTQADSTRWQIIAHQSSTGYGDGINIAETSTGSFDTNHVFTGTKYLADTKGTDEDTDGTLGFVSSGEGDEAIWQTVLMIVADQPNPTWISDTETYPGTEVKRKMELSTNQQITATDAHYYRFYPSLAGNDALQPAGVFSSSVSSASTAELVDTASTVSNKPTDYIGNIWKLVAPSGANSGQFYIYNPTSQLYMTSDGSMTKTATIVNLYEANRGYGQIRIANTGQGNTYLQYTNDSGNSSFTTNQTDKPKTNTRWIISEVTDVKASGMNTPAAESDVFKTDNGGDGRSESNANIFFAARYYPFPVQLPEGYNAYIAKAYKGGEGQKNYVKLTELADRKVPANSAFIVKSDNGNAEVNNLTYDILTTDVTTDVTNNVLKGNVYNQAYGDDFVYNKTYTLGVKYNTKEERNGVPEYTDDQYTSYGTHVAFRHPANKTQMAAYKAYLYVDEATLTTEASGAPAFIFNLDFGNSEIVTMTGAGYGTLYYDHALYVPTGVQAGTATVSGSQLSIDYLYQSGDVIPAYTAVILKADSGRYTFDHADEAWVEPTYPAANDLRGTLTDSLTTGGDTYYKLALSDDGETIGFYWGAPDGAVFTNSAHKAYLALSAGSGTGTRGFSLGEATSITAPTANDTTTNRIYDLQGRRLSRPANRGIYINNGRKVLVK